jgi:Flp pilus assembly protein CpaB
VENLAPSRLIKSRQGSIAVGIGALALAAILLLVYLSHYRNSVKSSSAPVPVLVAKTYIKKGTSFDTIARKGLFSTNSIPKDKVTTGAVSDAGALRGQVAAVAIYPAQQLTTTDFAATSTSNQLSGASDLTGSWRAISIPLDAGHGISPQAQTGDRVDVYVQLGGVMGLLMPNVLVLAAPGQPAAGTTAATSGNYILRVPTGQVERFTYASDNGKIWLALRPQNGVRPTRPGFVTASNFFRG